VHPHPHPTGHRLFDLAVAVSAIVISVISLFVAIEHSNVERQLVAANSWPYLKAEYSNQDHAGANRISLFVTNAGVGPAKLETVELFLHGQPIANSETLLSRCCGVDPNNHPTVHWTTGPQAAVLRPGETIELLALLQTPENKPVWDRLNQSLDGVTFRGCYCSVFDECWIGDMQGFNPTPVKACTAPSTPYKPR
jgi:hypothetical protein